MAITDSNLWSRYRALVTEKLRAIDPSISDDEIEKEMMKIANTVTVPITMHETTHDDIPDVRKTLYQTIDEIEASNDIISGAGVVVAQHKENLSPFVNMFIRWKKERSGIKKLKFAAEDKGDADKARYYDKLQLNLKSNKMNALYGILALVSSAFFHEYVPNAVTSSGRQLISHSAQMFEGFLGDNFKFLSMGECIDWIDAVCKYHKDDTLDGFVFIPTKEDLYERLVGSFINWPGDEFNYLKQYIDTLDDHDRTFLYYTNNMVKFVSSHKKMRNLLKDIFDKLPKDLTVMDMNEKLWKKYGEGKEFNNSNWRKMLGKQLFLDPYSPPPSISNIIGELRDFVWKYCYTPFLPMSPVSRLNKQKRKAVAVIDTDSNMIYTHEFTMLSDEVCAEIDTGIRDKKVNEIISMMIIANITDPVITRMIATVFKARKIGDEYLPNMIMKNEWYYSVMFFSQVKKRYAANAIIQEGLILPKPKADIKGFDFKKAAIPKKVQKILIDILIDRILAADEVDPQLIVNDINQLEETIKKSILDGSTEYWKVATFKDASAYKYPDRIQVYKGGMLWNSIYPDDKLESLDKACVAKLKKGAVINGVSCDNVIAVPMKLKKVPQEVVDALDVDLMAYNITSSFNSVLDCFEIDTTEVKTSSGGKIKKRSSVVNL